jgi:hypothetical protein
VPRPPRLTTSALAALTTRTRLLVMKLAAFTLGIVRQALMLRAPDAPAPDGPYRTAAQLAFQPPAAPAPTSVAATYAPAWQDFRHRRTTVLILALTFAPGVGLITFIGQRLLEIRALGTVAALGWMLGFAWNGLLLNVFLCPRCGERFVSRRWGAFGRTSNPFTSKCLHCGIRVGEEPAAKGRARE